MTTNNDTSTNWWTGVGGQTDTVLDQAPTHATEIGKVSSYAGKNRMKRAIVETANIKNLVGTYAELGQVRAKDGLMVAGTADFDDQVTMTAGLTVNGTGSVDVDVDMDVHNNQLNVSSSAVKMSSDAVQIDGSAMTVAGRNLDYDATATIDMKIGSTNKIAMSSAATTMTNAAITMAASTDFDVTIGANNKIDVSGTATTLTNADVNVEGNLNITGSNRELIGTSMSQVTLGGGNAFVLDIDSKHFKADESAFKFTVGDATSNELELTASHFCATTDDGAQYIQLKSGEFKVMSSAAGATAVNLESKKETGDDHKRFFLSGGDDNADIIFEVTRTAKFHNMQAGGTLKVTGVATLESDMSVGGNATITGTLGVTDAATLSSSLDVTGVTTLGDDLSVGGNAAVTGTLGVTAAATLSSSLDVTGVTTLGDDLSVGGNAAVTGTLGVTAAATLSDTLDVTGATTLGDDLSAAGNVTFGTDGTNAHTVHGKTTFKHDVSIEGDLNIKQALVVRGDTTYVNTTTLNVEDGKLELNMKDTQIVPQSAITGLAIAVTNWDATAQWITIRDSAHSDTADVQAYQVDTASSSATSIVLVAGTTLPSFATGDIVIAACKSKTAINNSGLVFHYHTTGASPHATQKVGFCYQTGAGDANTGKWSTDVGLSAAGGNFTIEGDSGDMALTGNMDLNGDMDLDGATHTITGTSLVKIEGTTQVGNAGTNDEMTVHNKLIVKNDAEIQAHTFSVNDGSGNDYFKVDGADNSAGNGKGMTTIDTNLTLAAGCDLNLPGDLTLGFGEWSMKVNNDGDFQLCKLTDIVATWSV